MRTLSQIMWILLLCLLSCTKDEFEKVWFSGPKNEVVKIWVDGIYTYKPYDSLGHFNVTHPLGPVFKVSKIYRVSGSDNVVGEIDESKSFLDVTSTAIRIDLGGIDLTYLITIYDKSGNKVVMRGEGIIYFHNEGWLRQNYVGGIGKFDGITGWSSTFIVTNQDTGIHTVTVKEGQATYRK